MIRDGQLCVAFTILTWILVVDGKASDGIPDVIRFRLAEQETLLRLSNAQVAIEQWQRDQLAQLRDGGNASWLEVARQQFLVETLTAQRIATQDTLSFVQALHDFARRQRASPESQGYKIAAEEPVITLSLPGSCRLVGWLGVHQVCETTRSRYLTILQEMALDRDEVERSVRLAAQRVIDCQARIQRLGKVAASAKVPRDLQRARLELPLAREALKLARMVQQHQQGLAELIEHWQTLSVAACSQPDGEDASAACMCQTAPNALGEYYVTSHSDPTLHGATLRVAAAEASQTGHVLAADITRQQMTLHLEAVRELQDTEQAARDEVHQATQRVELADYALHHLARQQHIFQDAYASLPGAIPLHNATTDRHGNPPSDAFDSRNANGSVAATTNVTSRDSQSQEELAHLVRGHISHHATDADWHLPRLPISFCNNSTAISYLIHLVAMKNDTEATRCAIRAELKLEQEMEDKLRKTDERLAARRATSNLNRTPDEFRELLRARRRRELAAIQFDIGHAEARLLAANERIQVIQLEWQRFGHQLRNQIATHRIRTDATVIVTSSSVLQDITRVPSHSPGDLANVLHGERANARRTTDVADDGIRPVSYLESPNLLHLARFRPPTWTTSYTVEYPRPSHPTRSIRFTHYRPLAYGRPWPRLYGRLQVGCITPSHRIWDLYPRQSCRLWTKPWRIPSYSDYYAFGIRRTDFGAPPSRHGRATPYGGPWYLPGAPTNF